MQIKEFFSKYWLIILILFFAFISRIWLLKQASVLWWDETIYIGMAKFIFSGGSLGYWEAFRPPLFPLILGFGWFVGFPILFWGKFLEIISVVLIVFLTFFLGKDFMRGFKSASKGKKNSFYNSPNFIGVLAAGIIAILPVIFRYGNLLLTNIPSTVFVLLAIVFFSKNKFFLAGLFSGLAFLMRFPQGIVFASFGFSLLISWVLFIKFDKKSKFDKNNFLLLLKREFFLLLGFLIPVLPYLVINFFQFGNSLFPFIEGSVVIHNTQWVYANDWFFYFVELFKENPLFIFSLFGFFFLFSKRLFKDKTLLSHFFIIVFFFAYFLTLDHKETRFIIPIIPSLALFSGFGVFKIVSFFKFKNGFLKKYFSFVVLIILTIFSLYNGFVLGSRLSVSSSLTLEQSQFYNFFENKTDLDDFSVITTNPLFMVFSNKPFVPLRSWDLAEKVYDTKSFGASHIAVDLCDHPCLPNSECEFHRESFVKKVDSENSLVFNKSYIRYDGVSCNLLIWEH